MKTFDDFRKMTLAKRFTQLKVHDQRNAGNIQHDDRKPIIKSVRCWLIIIFSALVLLAGSTNAAREGRNIADSYVDALTEFYPSGGASNYVLQFETYAISPDHEWVVYAELDFPTGVTVVSATPIQASPAARMLPFNGESGDGATLTWGAMSNFGQNYLLNGNVADFTVTVNIDSTFEGDMVIDWMLHGDDWGAAPHVVSGTVVIQNGNNCLADFTDPRDGSTYTAVLIGSQCWMAENLKYLPEVVGPETGSTTDPYYYVNGYMGTDASEAKATSNYQHYGALYNWQAALTACPAGWRLPSDNEWTHLVDYVVEQGFPNYSETNGAGNALKSCRQLNSPLGGECNTGEHPRWDSDVTHHGFDEFGFLALPGGNRETSGSFDNIGNYGNWWSSTEYASTAAWHRNMTSNNGHVRRYYASKGNGFSVRCLRDID